MKKKEDVNIKKLIEKCLEASPLAMADKEKYEELAVLLTKLSKDCTSSNFINIIYKYYFANFYNRDRTTTNSNEEKLKKDAGNVRRGCTTICKLTPLLYFHEHPLYPDIEDKEIDDINKNLIDMQNQMKPLLEKYLTMQNKFYGGNKATKRLVEFWNKDVQQFRDKNIMVITIDMLKEIGYTETSACRTVATLMDFSKHYEPITRQGVSKRYERTAP